MYERSVITYAGPVWAPMISPSSWRSLEAVQRIGLQTILGTPFYVRNHTILVTTNQITIQEFIRKSSQNFFYRNSFSTLHHKRTLGHSNIITVSNKFQQPFMWSNNQLIKLSSSHIIPLFMGIRPIKGNSFPAVQQRNTVTFKIKILFYGSKKNLFKVTIIVLSYLSWSWIPPFQNPCYFTAPGSQIRQLF